MKPIFALMLQIALILSIQAQSSNDKKAKVYYKDGKTIQYFVSNGVSVTMSVDVEKTYGKYYVAYIAIENFTGQPFNFNPNDIKCEITAMKYVDGETMASSKKVQITKDAKVLSSYEYMKKVRNRQTWSSIFYTFGESVAASQAGYSSSSTTSNTYGYGYYQGSYGSASVYGNSTTKSNTTNYNGGTAYAAQQNANNNINNFVNDQYIIINQLNQHYLKLNTLNNQERQTGQVNIPYQKALSIKITVPVNNKLYEFYWNANNK